jgi:hypothetical protein
MADILDATEISTGLLVAAAVLRAAGYTSEQACKQAKVLEIILRYGPLPKEADREQPF